MKKVLITGARSGIISKVIDNIINDYELYLTVHTDSQVRAMKDKYKNYKNVTCMKLDITNEYDYRKIENIDIDIYIANAAIAESGSMIEMPVDRIRDNFETNVFSNFKVLQRVLQKMIKKGRGKVIIMGSLAGKIPMPFLGAYSGSKASLIKMTEALRFELLLLDSDIKVSLILPGLYDTGFNKLAMDKKYDFMDVNSFFEYQLDFIHSYDKFVLFFEQRALTSIVNKICQAIYSDNPKFIYSAPFSQNMFTKIISLFW
ncbi:MAG TPA: SDR family NAD(P)-dependent oxidoreductase [Candidatus Coprosoma intestinipullorum]|uniref:SDR family NAD(P)-dependent oxidoreductase n=1 Tax=Candidatus Coprosoma intestinipullorum TaxID=2840752 RepID=A0A9D0ZQR1_9FIRM|nr:SDR family NAD(P)-dependent oxidoreductase [Candidatus Coprosoma intestinipullorum]